MKRLGFYFTITCLLYILTTPAITLASLYNVGGKSQNSDGNNTVGYGNYTYNLIENDPQLANDSIHVNSIYIVKDGSNFIEVGWYRKEGYSSPWALAVWKIHGTYGQQFLGSTPDNRWAKFQIHSIPGTKTWIAFLDNIEIKRWSDTGFLYGVPRLGSERNNTSDTNYGTFGNLQFREGNVTWKYWRDIVEFEPSNPDPNYYLYDDDDIHYGYSIPGS